MTICPTTTRGSKYSTISSHAPKWARTRESTATTSTPASTRSSIDTKKKRKRTPKLWPTAAQQFIIIIIIIKQRNQRTRSRLLKIRRLPIRQAGV